MTGLRPHFLDPGSVRLLLFGGKGGVGKTTCAVAAARYLARQDPGGSHLLVSTDPAHSLLNSLAGSATPANLEVREIDARVALQRFKDINGPALSEIAVRGTILDADDVTRLLELSLPGFDEVMAFYEIAKLLETERYKRIIVDTAPTGHTLRLLSMPKLFATWISALESMLKKHRYLSELYGSTYRPDAADAFISDVKKSLTCMRQLLCDESLCRFVPVFLAERLSVNETARLLKQLRRLRIPVTDVVSNRLSPPNHDCPRCLELCRRQQVELRRAASWQTKYRVWSVPEHAVEVRGGETLDHFWDDSPVPVATEEKPSPRPTVVPVDNPPSLFNEETRLAIFAGKGGVGKTTLACATALRCVRERKATRVLLFSTDPAHSLSDCLGIKIGPEPTPVVRGLTAIEIDAQEQFKEFKRLYASEITELFSDPRGSAGVSVQFDQTVLERILDLAPPGLDELMGLTTAVEMLHTGSYDTLILDAAPTGHLLRLLELPAQIEDWLKVLFGLFLKHKTTSLMPNLTAKLVTLSKRIKSLELILHDPRKTQLYIVTIPTEMAMDNSCGLSAACESLNVHIPHIFINQVTPPGGDCPFCLRRNEVENAVLEKAAIRLAGYSQSIVYQCLEPRGIKSLSLLGTRLYSPAVPEADRSRSLTTGGSHELAE